MDDPNAETFQAEKEMMAKWTFLRSIEEDFFKQRSRINWLKLGDQNTIFFMRVAAGRRSYNSIRSLLLPNGILVTDCAELCEIALKHFSGILAPLSLPPLVSSLQWFLDLHTFRCSPAQKHILSSLPSAEEIEKTLLKLNPNKSPEPDGFTSAFFKASWSIVGSETISAIQRFFMTAFLPTSTNATILTLVPKHPGASAITDYRPISCCNTTYKAISKKLVKRLKVILPQVILPNQTAFVQGRLLIENTVLASEIVQGYHKLGGPKRITIKVDIAKAFDTIRWEFIFQCLRSIAVPEVFLSWLHVCVCTTSFSLGFNGSSYGFFKGTRGLRQGDPLSPYLFVLAMNCLSISLNRAAREGEFQYHAKCQRSELTHLCFADDLLIFCDGTQQSVLAVLDVLKDFEQRSGLAVSITKTSMFTAGIKPHELVQLKAATGLEEGTLPVRYLGVPLCTKKLSLANCATLLQSIKTKLHTWTTHSLSFAGRLQLLATVIAGITNFWSCAFILPKGCLAEIDSLCSRFLWKGKTEGHNSAKVAWESVTTPKKGGLGLKDLRLWNLASVLKLAWILFFKQDSIWSDWFIREVLEGDLNNFWVINTKQKHSWQANHLILNRGHVYSWIKRDVGNGVTTYFWSSNWSPFGNITEFLKEDYASRLGIPQTSTLAELWELDHWTLPPARSEKQVKLYTFLLSLTITEDADTYIWCPGGTCKDRYSTRLTYDLVRGDHQSVTWYKEVWFSRGIPKHLFLTWLMASNRSPTRDRLLQWGLITDRSCLLCNTSPESRSHLFFDCAFSWSLWLKSLRKLNRITSRLWEELMEELRTFRGSRAARTILLLAWQATIYALWKERNARFHRNVYRSVDSIFTEIDRTIRARIASIRQDAAQLSSDMLYIWFSTPSRSQP